MEAHNLPHYMTTFVGREAEIDNISTRLTDTTCRLLTLVGPGGIGKTRLAVKVATQQTDRFSAGVYFVGLQPVASADNIIATIASAIGFEFFEHSPIIDQLLRFLHDKAMLLILDNYEHLLPSREVVTELLNRTSRLKLLITSREILNLRDEWLFQVDAMPYPSSETQEAIDAYSAVKLFVERGQRVRHNFSLGADAVNVMRVCQLVGGVPLGLELAAAWLKRLPCSEIAAQIQHSLDILETDTHGIPDRHRSMRAVFDQSWILLTEEERDVLMGLSVFRGGFRREAAEQVAGASLQTLSALSDKSILNINQDEYYRIHELQRQYAEEKLNDVPELRTAIHDSHCEYYCEFMNMSLNSLIGTNNKDTLRLIDQDIDNVRSAWAWAVEYKQVRNLKKAMTGIYWFAWLRSWHEEGEGAFHQAIDALRDTKPDVESEVALGQALSALGAMCIWLGRSQQASECLQESVSILRRLDAQVELTRALCAKGWLTTTQQDWLIAKSYLKEATTMAEETEQLEFRGFILGLLGRATENLGEYEEAEQYHQQALLLGRRIGDQRTVADSLCTLGTYSRRWGQYVKARQLFEESLSVAHTAEINVFIRAAYTGLGTICEAMGELEVARGFFEECLQNAKNEGREPDIARCLLNLANVQVSQGEYKVARTLYLESSTIMLDKNNRTHFVAVQTGLGNIAYHNEDYAEALRYYEISLTMNREIDDRSAISNNLVEIARISLMQNRNSQSRLCLLESLQVGIAIGAPPIILNSMMSIAELFVADSDLSSALQLATLITNHPASTAHIKERARLLLTHHKTDDDAVLEMDFQQVTEDDLEGISNQLVKKLESLVNQPLVEPLSGRELEVLRLIAEGKSNREIARELILALGTIKSHIHNIMQKLDASNRTEAVTRAMKYGLL